MTTASSERGGDEILAVLISVKPCLPSLLPLSPGVWDYGGKIRDEEVRRLLIPHLILEPLCETRSVLQISRYLLRYKCPSSLLADLYPFPPHTQCSQVTTLDCSSLGV
jgi:hypothetical protein